jgi:hypothetical protein
VPDDDHLLWHLHTPRGDVACRMVSCCGGAELQVFENDALTLRETYPDKEDLYERARLLKAEFLERSD